jgi:general L-amino acid transport system substrate-binding protein
MWRRAAAVLGATLVLAACSPDPRPKAPAQAIPKAQSAAPGRVFKAVPSKTLASVRKRGWLACGVNPGLPGFAYPDDRGNWRGFDVDICRAVAAATLGDARAVHFVPVSAEARLAALTSGQIDILSRNTSWTFARDAGMGVDFPAVTYFDGQGFLAPKALALTSAGELNGARICVQAGTASQANLADFFKARGLKYREVLVADDAQARERYQADGCDAFTADVSALAASRSVMNTPNAHEILPDVISKEPLGPVVRQDDPTWTDIVRWTVYATLLAEELKVSSRTAADLKANSQDPRVRRLLGVEGGFGAILGLKDDWAFEAIRQVGAYDEIFRRNVGDGSALKLGRGLNALWNAPQPGLMYPPPIR